MMIGNNVANMPNSLIAEWSECGERLRSHHLMQLRVSSLATGETSCKDRRQHNLEVYNSALSACDGPIALRLLEEMQEWKGTSKPYGFRGSVLSGFFGPRQGRPNRLIKGISVGLFGVMCCPSPLYKLYMGPTPNDPFDKKNGTHAFSAAK